jgi:hypothetical protein
MCKAQEAPDARGARSARGARRKCFELIIIIIKNVVWW